MALTLELVRKACPSGDWLHQPLPWQTPLRGASLDTRALGSAAMFFALRGEQHDGHDHLADLGRRGQVQLAVVERERVERGVAWGAFRGAVLGVDSVEQTLLRLGQAALAERRRQGGLTVVAITGSHGKTTTKEWVAHVLAGARRVSKAPHSYNNELGVPLTLLAVRTEDEVLVLEFAARHAGDIRLLTELVAPDIGVLLNVGSAHLGEFGSRDAIYDVKGELFRYLPTASLAITSAEDVRLLAMARAHGRHLSFGRLQGDYRATAITYNAAGQQRFIGEAPAQDVSTEQTGPRRLALQTSIQGTHGHVPILVAWIVAEALGVPAEVVQQRVTEELPLAGRGRTYRSAAGAWIIDDTYNASPETVIHRIESMAVHREPRRRVLVLGSLAELGSHLEAGLRSILAVAIEAGMDRVVLFGDQYRGLSLPLLASSFEVSRVASSAEDALRTIIAAEDRPGVLLGLKGSRVAAMERFLPAEAPDSSDGDSDG